MDNATLLAVIDSLVADAIKNIQLPESRGIRGAHGRDGNDFNLEDHRESIVKLILENIPKDISLTDEQMLLLKGEMGTRGISGRDGLDGRDGRDFIFEDHKDSIDSLIKEHSIKFEDFTQEQKDELRGERGANGRDGRDFIFEDHKDSIDSLIKEHSIKFGDFTQEQKDELRGEKGSPGQDGRDGKNFDVFENIQILQEAVQHTVNEIQESLKLKFEDLTQEQKEELRGPSGLRGKDGRDFTFQEYEYEIKSIIQDVVVSQKEHYKIKFEDFTQEQKEELRGEKGLQGKHGRDFEFEEHQEKITNLLEQYVDSKKAEYKFTFEDFTEEQLARLKGGRGQKGQAGKSITLEETKPHIEEFVQTVFEESKDSLKLKFTDLTDIEKEGLKLKFDDLTYADKQSIKGARGQRGKTGRDGVDGKDGKDGINGLSIRGPIGPAGTKGLDGKNGIGRDGVDGKDAAQIEQLLIDQTKNHFSLILKMDDGSVIKSNEVKLPNKNVTNIYNSAGASYSSGDSNGSANIILPSVACDADTYVGAVVRMTVGEIAVNALADSLINSNAIGIVEKKITSILCDIRVLGVSDEYYVGLDLSKEYFLSDTIPGGITSVAPMASGSVRLKIGQPYSSTRLLVLKGERTLRE